MNASQPPALATHLLARLGSGPNREVLAGDLIERYRQGRSTGWYWRQVLAAILVGAGTDIRAHKLVAMRAVLTGWAVLFLFFGPWGALRDQLMVGGLVDLRLWVGVQVPTWVSGCVVLAIACAGFGGSGWSVARFHRAHQTSAVFIYLVSVLLCGLSAFVWWTMQPLVYPSHLRLAYDFTLTFVLMSISILLGGLWSAARATEEPPCEQVASPD